MKLRIGAVEILDPTWEELEALIDKYGGRLETGGEITATEHTDPPRHQPRKNGGDGPSTKDRVVLERLIQEGAVSSKQLGEILGRRGKSIRPGLREWAHRIGLTHDQNIDPFEEARVGSQRGARLKESLQHIAKELLKGL